MESSHCIERVSRQLACFHSLVWVSIVCDLVFILHIIFSYIHIALVHIRSSPTHKFGSVVHGPMNHSINCAEDVSSISLPYGGGAQHSFPFEVVAPYVVQGDTGSSNNVFKFVVHGKHVNTRNYGAGNFVLTKVPLCNIVRHISVEMILKIAQIHKIKITSHIPKSVMVTYFDAHHCATCNNAITIFSVAQSKLARDRNCKRTPTNKASIELETTRRPGNSVQQEPQPEGNRGPSLSLRQPLSQTPEVNHTTEVKENPCRCRCRCHRASNRKGVQGGVQGKTRRSRPVNSSHIEDSTPTMPIFPPSPPDNKLMCDIARDFCSESSPDKMEEAGCTVCGQLTPSSELSRLKSVKQCLHILQAQGITRIERTHSSKPINEFNGPVIDHKCNRICDNCRKHLRTGQVPRNALANGLWIGTVPDELSSLRFTEKLLIACVCINSCFI